jgi:hypothetical protein
MANLINTTNFKSEYSENILPTTALISDSSDLSYSGDGLVTISNDYQFSDNKSLKLEMPISTSINTQTYFNLGSDLEYQAKYDGNYIFSFRFLNDSLGITNQLINIKLNVFVNSLLTHTFVIEKQQSYYSPINFYTFCQSFNLSPNDIVNFTFEVDSEPIAPAITLKLYFSGFKLELDDRFLGLPSVYSKPKDYDISQTQGYLKNTHQGWGYYADSLTTPSITIGTTYTQITIDALGALTNTNYLPLEIRGTSNLWSGNKITPISVGDDYDGRFDVTISAKSGSPSYIEVILDISGSTAGTNKVFTGYIQTGSATPYDQSLPLDFFSLTTFLSNGGRLYAKVDTGSVTLTRRNIKISRKSKAF